MMMILKQVIWDYIQKTRNEKSSKKEYMQIFCRYSSISGKLMTLGVGFRRFKCFVLRVIDNGQFPRLFSPKWVEKNSYIEREKAG